MTFRALRMSCLYSRRLPVDRTFCGGESSVKIGVMADMNGPLSTASGRGSVEAARIAAEQFNWSVNGKPIRWFTTYFSCKSRRQPSQDSWDLVKIIKIIPGDEAFRPLSESECPLLK
jgi:hypothetical protein